MKISQIITASALVAATMFTSCSDAPVSAPAITDNIPAILKGDKNLSLDLAGSTLHWKGEMLGLYSHDGNVKIASGSVGMKDGKINGGTFTIDMAAIEPLDNGYDEADHSKANLIGHLSSPDFFDIANHPTATFTITGATANTVTGNLTLKGKTNPETIENVTITPDVTGAKISGKMKIDRKKYDVNFDMPVKDKVLSNDISFDINLVVKG